MPNKKIAYTLKTRVATLGKFKGKTVVQAYATQRKRVDYRSFCAEVARGSSFMGAEVEAILRLAADVAKAHIENGESVDFGDIGTLTPSFRSKQVEGDEKDFDAKKCISSPRIRLLPSRRYFTINSVGFERVSATDEKEKKKDTNGGKTPVSPSQSTPAGGGPDL